MMKGGEATRRYQKGLAGPAVVDWLGRRSSGVAALGRLPTRRGDATLWPGWEGNWLGIFAG